MHYDSCLRDSFEKSPTLMWLDQDLTQTDGTNDPRLNPVLPANLFDSNSNPKLTGPVIVQVLMAIDSSVSKRKILKQFEEEDLANEIRNPIWRLPEEHGEMGRSEDSDDLVDNEEDFSTGSTNSNKVSTHTVLIQDRSGATAYLIAMEDIGIYMRSTPLGTKLEIQPSIEIVRGVMLARKPDVKVLGGQISQLEQHHRERLKSYLQESIAQGNA